MAIISVGSGKGHSREKNNLEDLLGILNFISANSSGVSIEPLISLSRKFNFDLLSFSPVKNVVGRPLKPASLNLQVFISCHYCRVNSKT